MSMSAKRLHKIFAYGTLKRGQPNNCFMNDASLGYSKFLAPAVTLVKLPLVIATKWNLPFLLDAPGVGEHIHGEVYEVDDKFLQWLNDFECLYSRKNVAVNVCSTECLDSKCKEIESDIFENQTIWAYFLTNYPKNLLKLPCYSCYDCYGPHKRIYKSSSDDSSPTNLMDALKKEVENNEQD